MFTVKNKIDLLSEHEAIMIGVFDRPLKLQGIMAELDSALDAQLKQLLKSNDISGKKKSVAVVHTLGKIGTEKACLCWFRKRK